MIILYAFAIGFLANRVAGEDKAPLFSGKIWSVLFCALVLLAAPVVEMPHIYLTGPLSLYLFRQLGRGEYNAALLGQRIDRVQQSWIDPWLERAVNADKRPVLYGLAGNTIVGAAGGMLMAAGFLNPWMIVAGASMGVVAYAATLLVRDKRRAWELGEALHGGILYAAIVI